MVKNGFYSYILHAMYYNILVFKAFKVYCNFIIMPDIETNFVILKFYFLLLTNVKVLQ